MRERPCILMTVSCRSHLGRVKFYLQPYEYPGQLGHMYAQPTTCSHPSVPLQKKTKMHVPTQLNKNRLHGVVALPLRKTGQLLRIDDAVAGVHAG